MILQGPGFMYRQSAVLYTASDTLERDITLQRSDDLRAQYIAEISLIPALLCGWTNLAFDKFDQSLGYRLRKSGEVTHKCDWNHVIPGNRCLPHRGQCKG